MALIPLGEGQKRRGFSLRGKQETGFRWMDVIYVLIMAFLFVMLIFPPTDAIVIGNFYINFRLFVLLLIAILYIQRTIVKFDEYERGVVFRLGKFKEVAGPGWTLIFPLLEKYVRVDLRLHVYTIDPQEVVTRDKVRFLVSPEVFMYVSDPKSAVINVRDYESAVLSYVNSALTHICGSSTSDYIVSHMDEITHKIEASIHKAANQPGREWGVVVPKIKLTFIRFPEKVQDAMHEKVAAEQLKLAAHEKAEAIKVEIDAIREAGSKLTDPALTYMYLEALDKIARGRATKIVLPLEISRLAESITKRTGVSPESLITPEMVNYYKDVMDKYEQRIRSIEKKLEKDEIEPKRLEEYKEDIEKEEEEYKKRIEEIKKRLGVIKNE
ncbi:MAG: hypothetical protein DRO90_01600 [Candidatus Altiarchaeales archaeon]|nr:MAG: hypothetical protein DRO95_00045 [Candidatus Altiarchaeales archaeon]RLI94707.1 MAG: hypothetical protein DRO90_01600 [Candidatus Altiarchaeales archaeon]RLI94755.1 MAG: hypothetical protein DRO94_02145 [Candidatus Altiarchaeales archaeon]HDO82808.1 hypothetical protein [Candidatus Altiarchaeales archaeon]HEX55457.1 hypothetical protein [Candidatus Altiarchaeales archaeon]